MAQWVNRRNKRVKGQKGQPTEGSALPGLPRWGLAIYRGRNV